MFIIIVMSYVMQSRTVIVILLSKFPDLSSCSINMVNIFPCITIFQQSSNSENLPGGAGFIPHERFTYLTLTIISGTLMLGILFPQSE